MNSFGVIDTFLPLRSLIFAVIALFITFWLTEILSEEKYCHPLSTERRRPHYQPDLSSFPHLSSRLQIEAQSLSKLLESSYLVILTILSKFYVCF